MPKIKVEEMDEIYRKEKKATRTFQANICLWLMFRDHVLSIKITFIRFFFIMRIFIAFQKPAKR